MNIEMLNINKSFYKKNKQIDVLNQFTYTFNEGKLYLLKGSSGTGKTKKFRHDFRAHISTIKEYVYLGEYEQLKDYIVQMTEYINERKRKIYTSNHAINAVVSDIIAQHPNVEIVWHTKSRYKIKLKQLD